MATLSLHVDLRLDDFSLSVAEDLELEDVTALFGPSGAGKTTLLRVIAGLENRAAGRIALDDAIWQDRESKHFVPPHKRNLGYVFQDGRLFPHLTVEKNLRFSERRATHADALTLADVAAALDLTALLPRNPASLSGGEQRRVAIGRALLRNPALMLMDEPLSALDAKRKAEIIPYIARLPHDFGIPILYVTHNVEEVTRLATRIVLLAQGQVAANGDAIEVLERIDLEPLAGHLEAGAILEVRAKAHLNGMTTLDVAGQDLRIPGTAVAPGSGLRLRIQARDVALATQPPQGLSIRNILRARILSIDLVEEIFAEVLLDVGGQHLRSRVTREAVDDLQLASGQEVFALIKSVAIDRDLLS
jgi:molybdate transport system ATP-binding protein